MNYQETTNWMFNQLPMYQNLGAVAYKEDLGNTLLLADYLGNPQKNIKCIHVAGTNGKGSTSHLLASVFQEAGYKVGLYTSPHLKDFRERIKINGKEIPEQFVIDFIDKHKPFFESNQLSFFEMTVGLAFDYYNQNNVDIAIIEVGMGGRLDATNIITPLLSVITNISADHTQFLGTTMESIATEKAGIIKNNVPVVIGEYTTETKPVFLARANEKASEIFFASDNFKNTFPSALTGNYQENNKKTVLQALAVISANQFIISPQNIKDGFMNVITNTGLHGRWQQLNDRPKVICDTAHNKSGLECVLKQIEKEKYERLHIVLGMVNDKDLNEILPLFPKDAEYYFCKPNIPRGLDTSTLQQKAIGYKLKGASFNSVTAAYQAALKNASVADFIYIGGSTFVVAEIL